MDGKKGLKAKLSDEERTQLSRQLDEEMCQYLSSLEKKAFADGWTEDSWEKEMEKHPFFASSNTLSEQAAKNELSPLMIGLQQLKYSEEDYPPEELVQSYKADGNFHFKLKKYRLAIVAYTEGLKICKKTDLKDNLIRVQLITNRAAAQFHLGNMRSSLNDCTAAFKLKKDHLKALHRAIDCSFRLSKFKEAEMWCNRVLDVDRYDTFTRCRLAQAIRIGARTEWNARNMAAHDRNVLKAIGDRHIRLDEDTGLDPVHDGVTNKKVHLSPENLGALIWPVLFLYPEYGEVDVIEEFEDKGQYFNDHLLAMFGHGIERPSWDKEDKYHPDDLVLYFFNKAAKKMVQVDKSWTLSRVLSDDRFIVSHGTPEFIIVVKDSEFQAKFISMFS